MTSVEVMAETLDKAKAIVTGDRNDSYGNPIDNHERTADFQLPWLKHRLVTTNDGGCCELTHTALDVCAMNILQKLSRAVHDPTHADNWVDIAGYAANAAACAKSLE
jgi:hypothetical protein